MSDHALYRLIWRWHFYAGLIVAPFLLILSVTGAIYLFSSEINDARMPELQRVEPVAQAHPASHLIGMALEAHPGSATQIDFPADATRPAKIYVTPESGEPLQVMVDPGSGNVLGSYVYERTIVGFAHLLHGTLMVGSWGDALVELAACWALVLIGSGIFLWWPRGARTFAGVLWPRLTAKGRMFWRDLHAVTGVWTVALIAFLILTGLPWAVVQGPLVRGALVALGIGNESQGFGAAPLQSRPTGEVLGDVPWSQEALPMPSSDPAHAMHNGGMSGPDHLNHAAIAGVDAVVAKAAELGLSRDYQLYLPIGPTGVYTVMNSPGRPQEQLMFHFDRWSHDLLSESGWSHYGAGAKAIELGVQIHQGRYFGRINQIVMLLPCIGIVTLVVSGVTMWWRRRPKGKFGAPPAMSGARLRGVITVAVIASVLLPLFGASLAVLLLLDRIVSTIRHRAFA